MPEGLLQLGAEIPALGQGRTVHVSSPGSRDSYDPPGSWPALRRVGKDDYTRKESRLLAGPLLASLRTRRFWPGFQQLPQLANHSLVICGPRWSCARGCSPQMKALLQPGHPSSCLRARQAGTSCSRSPLSAQLLAAEMDVISRTSCVRTHALPLRRRRHTRTSLDVFFLCALCETCFPAPGSLFLLLHFLFLRHFPPESPGLAHSPSAPLPSWCPSPSLPGGERAAETRPARRARAVLRARLGPQSWPLACALFVFPSLPEC